MGAGEHEHDPHAPGRVRLAFGALHSRREGGGASRPRSLADAEQAVARRGDSKRSSHCFSGRPSKVSSAPPNSTDLSVQDGDNVSTN